ncbi:helix-turn-helix domain-containing protein, partial [Stutzerimonas kunmingensis]|uniref:helix-turn-helix domain-containing protein n=1 Tax=Stutzerimonas kunmingensis TaxID=1211807 RepID=UPI003AF93428
MLAGTPLRHVAETLGIAESLLGKWKRQYEQQGDDAFLRIPRHSDTQPTLIRTPVPRSFGQAVGAQRRRGGIVSLRC